jgi:hypothetical protein
VTQVRRKTFITYHHDDQQEVTNFIDEFDYYRDVFITRGLAVGMPNDVVIHSYDTEYVMRRIREDFLTDSTVTVVLIGRCTWARRYVDWEIQASLRHGQRTTPNGLLGIVLHSAGPNPTAPDRLRRNLPRVIREQSYARWYWYPDNAYELASWIEDAYEARTARDHLIENPRDKFAGNMQCN